MPKNPEIVVAEMGNHLAQQSRLSKDIIVKSLRRAVSALVELGQESSLEPFIKPLNLAIIKHGLVRHKDKDVRLLVAVCVCEILRVLAPDPSFDDKVFKDIFELFIDMFMELADTNSPYFDRRANILETVSKLQCCRKMLDLGCDNLILKMFTTFFSVVREGHQESLTNGMVSIMSLILNEEEETPQPLLEVILHNLVNKGEGPSPASHRLAVGLIQNCAEKIKPDICGFIMSCISDRESVPSELKERYHEVIIEIFQCTPNMLLAIIPTLVEELVTDQVDTRIKAVTLIGKLLALRTDQDFHGHNHLFVELLKRFSDKSADVRISVIHAVKKCYMANPSGIESNKVLTCLEGRLLDLDASVRVAAIAVVCDLCKSSLKNFPDALIARATDRLRDKMASVRKEALRKLLEVYREYCTKCRDEQMALDGCYEQIPCKILVLSLDKNLKEFRPQYLELLLATDFFPASLPGQDRMEHWIYLYSLFTPAHVKALNLILSQKRRFQSEMRTYLSLRIKEKGIDLEELNMSAKNAFTQISATFLNPVKVEECFLKLNQMKDTSILFPLMQLLNEPVLLNSKIIRDKYLKDIGNRHSLFEFLELLSLRCSNNIFSSEHIRHLLYHISGSTCRGNDVEESSFNLLSDAVRNFPLLLRDSEDEFKRLILEEDSVVCEKLLHLLANLGPSMSMELSEIYPLLERMCLEGTRAQSKSAILIIAGSLGSYGNSRLMDLCQKLVTSLHCGWKIPTALQSLGCILQHSDLAYQQHEEEVSSYIREQIFYDKTAENSVSIDEKSQSCVSSSCILKIYGLKALVKSVLPKKGTHGGEKIRDLIDLLSKLLLGGDFADEISACEIDRAHMRLAAAKSILRLSRRWDMHISPRIFHSTIMIAKDASSSIRKAFIDKTYKLLKRHAASRKFACVFAMAASDCVKDLQDASFAYLAELIKEYGRAAKSPSNKEGSMTEYPEYIIVFLLHALAHDADFPPIDSHDEERFAQFCRPLLLFLHVLVNCQHVDGNLSFISKTFLHLRSIFRAIRRAEDAVEPEQSLKLHVLADIGIFSLNHIQPDGIDFSHALGLVLLPSSLYRTSAARSMNSESCSQRGFVNEEFVRKLIHIFECDFSQVSSSSLKHAQNPLKGGLQGQNVKQGQNVIYSVGSKQSDMLRNLTSQKKIVAKENARTCVLEACPKIKRQKNVDEASVIKESDANGSKNSSLQTRSKSSNLELFGMESDISTQDFDASLSIPLDESTWKSSYESTKPPQLSKVKFNHACSSDGSTVSSEGQRVAKKRCVRGAAEAIVTYAGEGAAETQGPGNSEHEILADKTNSLAASGLPKNRKPKSCQGHKVHVEVPASHVSDENENGVAYRTRRRRAA